MNGAARQRTGGGRRIGVAAGRGLGLRLGLVLALAGCASLPPAVVRPPSTAQVAPAAAPLAALAGTAGLAASGSGVWPLLQGSFALDARLAMIANATTSLDLQSYLIGDDATGRLVLRALRDAAARGVRVRLLVDDLYTGGMDRLLLGLADTPNVEVRLFNPFVTARESGLRRLLALATDFGRLNHRMHNKLFVADGALAVVGGRNLADEYFLRGTRGNFIDFDLTLAGAIVPELSRWFDVYWNSRAVYPLRDVLRASDIQAPTPAEARAAFDTATQPAAAAAMAMVAPVVPPAEADAFGAPPFSVQLADRRLRLLPAATLAHADAPAKIDPAHASRAAADTVAHRFLLRLADARDDVLLISPYFVPGAPVLDRIRALRAAGARVRIVTNSLAVSDEPLVSVGFERHQVELLEQGVELFEISSTRLKLDRTLRGLLGESIGRLHAKLALIDRRTVLVGSMNLDPRSAAINTEMGVAVDSPPLAAMILAGLRIEEMVGVYQVRLAPDGRGVRWTALDADSTEQVLDVDPDTSFWQRLRLLLLSVFVPESQL